MRLSRRQFLKLSTGTIAGLAMADCRISADREKRTPIYKTNYPTQLRHGSGVMLKLDRTRVLLAFKEPQSQTHQESFEFKAIFENSNLQRESFLVKEKAATGKFYPKNRVNDTDTRIWAVSRSGEHIDQNEESVRVLKEALRRTLKWVGPVYRFPGTKDSNGLVCPLPNVLLIRPAFKVQDGVLDRALLQFQLRHVPEISKYLAGYRYYVIDNADQQTVYDVQQTLLEKYTALVEEAQFDFMPLFVPVAAPFQPTDPLYSQQWNLQQINAQGGWNISNPASVGENVVVAVIDYGCDLKHPDLKDAFFLQQGATPAGATFDFDQRANVPNILPGGWFEPGESHGTWCAGIVAAQYNNIGIAGLAGKCMILPLRIKAWSTSVVAAAIGYSAKLAQNGVSVISMSFGGDVSTDDYLKDLLIYTAIEGAFNKGILLCAATMNTNENKIYYPGAHPLVIACGASNHKDDRCDPSDWGQWHGSNYGHELSVVAPGVDIPTTANSDPNTSSLNYTLVFWGTSAATPHVAGLAALLISHYPALKNDPGQVRNIIERAADKVGIVPYSSDPGKPNGTWNEQMGYGRINVLAALNEAGRMFSGVEPPPPTDLRIK